MENRGQRAIDIDRQRLADRRCGGLLQRRDESDCVAVLPVLTRQLEQHLDSRIDAVNAVTESGEPRTFGS